jgi:His/Glu/Gln/Arg/opine family amino acid ABC transporter permease subunit
MKNTQRRMIFMERTSWEWIQLFLSEYSSSFLRGAASTLEIALISTIIGCIIGFVVGVIRSINLDDKDPWYKKGILNIIKMLLAVYVEVFRGTPMMVQAMVVYYGSYSMFGVNLSATAAAYVVVSINTGAYMAETVRGGIQSVSGGQIEAAQALGMRHVDTMLSVILPQAFFNILPQIGNNLIINVKDTSVLNVISCTELFFVTSSITGTYYRYFEPFLIACVIYLFMTFTLSRLLRLLESKMKGSDNYVLAADYLDDNYGNGTFDLSNERR